MKSFILLGCEQHFTRGKEGESHSLDNVLFKDSRGPWRSVGSAIQQGVLCRIIHQNLDTVPLAEDVNLRMLASRYLTMEQGCWGVCVTNRTLVIMASVCEFDMCVSCAWCLILRKKWHSIRYTLPNSECARNLNWMSTDSKCYSICEARPFILYVTGSVTQCYLNQLMSIDGTCHNMCDRHAPECDWSSSRWLNWMSSGSTSYSPPGSHIGSTVYPEQSILYLVWRDFQFFIAEVCVLHNKNVMKPSVFESLNVYFVFWYVYFRLKQIKSDVFFLFYTT